MRAAGILLALLTCSVVASAGVNAQTVTVMVVPYIDSDAWAPQHVDAFEKFLGWCEQNHVHVAVFHYNTNTAKDSKGTPITEVIKEYADKGVITMVGLHSTSHSIDGLPLSIQYWELKFNMEFLKNNIGKNVVPVFSVPYWVFDPNTIKACAMVGIKAMISGQSVATLNPNYKTPLSQLNPIAQRMIPGYFEVTVGGKHRKVYYIPAVSYWDDLVPQAKSANETVDTYLESVVDQLVKSDVLATLYKGENVTLELWVLIHPWEMADSSRGVSAYESFLEDIASGKLNHTVTVNGVKIQVNFELADPVDAIKAVLEGKTPLVPMPQPSLYYLLEMQDFEPWWKLEDMYPDKVDIIRAWRDVMNKLWSIDGELMALTKAGLISGNLKRELLEVVENIWSAADLSCVVKWWDPTAAKVDIEKEDALVDTLVADVSEAFANMVAKQGSASSEGSSPEKQTSQETKTGNEPVKKPSTGGSERQHTSESNGGGSSADHRTSSSHPSSHGAPLVPLIPPLRRRRC